MKIALKVLTPVHISSGEEVSPTGYFIDREKGHLHRIDMESLFADPAFARYRDVFIQKASTARYLGEIIQDTALLKKHVLYSLPTTPDFRNINPINIKLFIKSAGRVYIPGSSVKGAIVSALLCRALKALHKSEKFDLTPMEYDKLLNKAYAYLSDGLGQKEEPTTNKNAAGRFLNLFDLSDSNFLPPEKCLRVDVARVIGARRGGQIPIVYETLKEGTVFELELKRKRCRFSEKEILEICHEFYTRVARKDQVSVPQNPYLCRLGQGSSRWAVSFLIAAQELGINYNVRPARTKKRIIYGMEQKPMGFVQLLT